MKGNNIFNQNNQGSYIVIEINNIKINFRYQPHKITQVLIILSSGTPLLIAYFHIHNIMGKAKKITAYLRNCNSLQAKQVGPYMGQQYVHELHLLPINKKNLAAQYLV